MGSRELCFYSLDPIKTYKAADSSALKIFVSIFKPDKKSLLGIFLEHAALLNTPEPFYKPVQ